MSSLVNTLKNWLFRILAFSVSLDAREPSGLWRSGIEALDCLWELTERQNNLLLLRICLEILRSKQRRNIGNNLLFSEPTWWWFTSHPTRLIIQLANKRLLNKIERKLEFWILRKFFWSSEATWTHFRKVLRAYCFNELFVFCWFFLNVSSPLTKLYFSYFWNPSPHRKVWNRVGVFELHFRENVVFCVRKR